MKFRYDINALRAISILAVLFFHYKVKGFGGGFTGVDVFFVISGYLMTDIINKSINNETFTLQSFYAKRLQRIAPALLALLAFVCVVGFFMYFPTDFNTAGKNLISSALFTSNLWYWQSSNYFAPASDNNIVLHTWSLSVEWQFYLLYPIILAFLIKSVRNERVLRTIFWVSTILLAIVSFAVTRYNATASFYLFPTRSWEMLAGGAAFYLQNKIRNNPLKLLTALLGYMMIFAGIVILKKDMAWPGIYTLIPVTGAVLVIIANVNNLKILQTKASVFFGKISYSLYLWHWPVYVIAKYVGLFGMLSNVVVVTILTIVSILLAYLSLSYIEQKKYQAKHLLISMFSFSAIVGLLILTDANKVLFKEESLKLSNYEKDNKEKIDSLFSAGKCFLSNVHTFNNYNKEACLCTVDSVKNILLIGDSHAAHLAASLKDTFAVMNINLAQAMASGCLPVLNAQGQSQCKDLINYIYKDYLPEHAAKYDAVIISGHWIGAANKEALVKDLRATIRFLHDLHLKTVILGQTESYSIPYPFIVAWGYQLNKKLDNLFIQPETGVFNDYLRQNLKDDYVDIYNQDSIPGILANGVPYIFDKDHLSKEGAVLRVRKMFEQPLFESMLK